MAHETPVRSALHRRANICLLKLQGWVVMYDVNMHSVKSLSSPDATSIAAQVIVEAK